MGDYNVISTEWPEGTACVVAALCWLCDERELRR